MAYDLNIKIGAEIQGLQKAIAQLTGRLDQVEKEAKQAGQSIDKMSKAGAGMGKMVKTLAGVAAGFVGISAAIRVVSSGINTMISFEKTMAEVGAVADVSGKKFDMMSKKAREMGATTVFSATQAAEGLKFLSMAGFSAENATKSLQGTLRLAQAGNLELGRSADIVSNIMTAFGQSAEQTEDMVDDLATTASRSNTSIEQLGDAMKYAGTIAHGFGITSAETSAAIGVLSDAGLQASMAGTGLRQVFVQIANQSGKMKEGMNELGITFSQINPETNSLTDILNVFGNTSITAGQAVKMFGARAAGAFMALKDGRGKLASLNKEMANNKGRAAEMQMKMDDTLSADIEKLKSAFAEVAIGQGEFQSALRESVKWLTTLVQVLGGTADTNSEYYDSVNKTVTIVKRLVKAFIVYKVAAQAYVVWTKAAALWQRLFAAEGFRATIAAKAGAIAQGIHAIAVKGLAWAFRGTIVAIKLFKIALASTGIGLIVVAIMAVIGAVAEWVMGTDEAAQKNRDAFEQTKRGVEDLVDTQKELNKETGKWEQKDKTKKLQDVETKDDVKALRKKLVEARTAMGKQIRKELQGEADPEQLANMRKAQRSVIDQIRMVDDTGMAQVRYNEKLKLTQEFQTRILQRLKEQRGISEDLNKLAGRDYQVNLRLQKESLLTELDEATATFENYFSDVNIGFTTKDLQDKFKDAVEEGFTGGFTRFKEDFKSSSDAINAFAVPMEKAFRRAKEEGFLGTMEEFSGGGEDGARAAFSGKKWEEEQGRDFDKITFQGMLQFDEADIQRRYDNVVALGIQAQEQLETNQERIAQGKTPFLVSGESVDKMLTDLDRLANRVKITADSAEGEAMGLGALMEDAMDAGVNVNSFAEMYEFRLNALKDLQKETGVLGTISEENMKRIALLQIDALATGRTGSGNAGDFIGKVNQGAGNLSGMDKDLQVLAKVEARLKEINRLRGLEVALDWASEGEDQMSKATKALIEAQLKADKLKLAYEDVVGAQHGIGASALNARDDLLQLGQSVEDLGEATKLTWEEIRAGGRTAEGGVKGLVDIMNKLQEAELAYADTVSKRDNEARAQALSPFNVNSKTQTNFSDNLDKARTALAKLEGAGENMAGKANQFSKLIDVKQLRTDANAAFGEVINNLGGKGKTAKLLVDVGIAKNNLQALDMLDNLLKGKTKAGFDEQQVFGQNRDAKDENKIKTGLEEQIELLKIISDARKEGELAIGNVSNALDKQKDAEEALYKIQQDQLRAREAMNEALDTATAKVQSLKDAMTMKEMEAEIEAGLMDPQVLQDFKDNLADTKMADDFRKNLEDAVKRKIEARIAVKRDEMNQELLKEGTEENKEAAREKLRQESEEIKTQEMAGLDEMVARMTEAIKSTRLTKNLKGMEEKIQKDIDARKEDYDKWQAQLDKAVSKQLEEEEEASAEAKEGANAGISSLAAIGGGGGVGTGGDNLLSVAKQDLEVAKDQLASLKEIATSIGLRTDKIPEEQLKKLEALRRNLQKRLEQTKEADAAQKKLDKGGLDPETRKDLQQKVDDLKREGGRMTEEKMTKILKGGVIKETEQEATRVKEANAAVDAMAGLTREEVNKKSPEDATTEVIEEVANKILALREKSPTAFRANIKKAQELGGSLDKVVEFIEDKLGKDFAEVGGVHQATGEALPAGRIDSAEDLGDAVTEMGREARKEKFAEKKKTDLGTLKEMIESTGIREKLEAQFLKSMKEAQAKLPEGQQMTEEQMARRASQDAQTMTTGGAFTFEGTKALEEAILSGKSDFKPEDIPSTMRKHFPRLHGTESEKGQAKSVDEAKRSAEKRKKQKEDAIRLEAEAMNTFAEDVKRFDEAEGEEKEAIQKEIHDKLTKDIRTPYFRTAERITKSGDPFAGADVKRLQEIKLQEQEKQRKKRAEAVKDDDVMKGLVFDLSPEELERAQKVPQNRKDIEEKEKAEAEAKRAEAERAEAQRVSGLTAEERFEEKSDELTAQQLRTRDPEQKAALKEKRRQLFKQKFAIITQMGGADFRGKKGGAAEFQDLMGDKDWTPWEKVKSPEQEKKEKIAKDMAEMRRLQFAHTARKEGLLTGGLDREGNEVAQEDSTENDLLRKDRQWSTRVDAQSRTSIGRDIQAGKGFNRKDLGNLPSENRNRQEEELLEAGRNAGIDYNEDGSMELPSIPPPMDMGKLPKIPPKPEGEVTSVAGHAPSMSGNKTADDEPYTVDSDDEYDPSGYPMANADPLAGVSGSAPMPVPVKPSPIVTDVQEGVVGDSLPTPESVELGGEESETPVAQIVGEEMGTGADVDLATSVGGVDMGGVTADAGDGDSAVLGVLKESVTVLREVKGAIERSKPTEAPPMSVDISN